jgi:hypothetical protein
MASTSVREETMNLQDCTETPATISEHIERFVRSRTGGMIRDLHVDVAGEHVVISGRTSTYYNKQLATHGAMAAVKNAELVNDIEVC